MNDIAQVAEKIYKEENPNSITCAHPFVYEEMEAVNRRRISSRSDLSLYNFYKKEVSENNKLFKRQ